MQGQGRSCRIDVAFQILPLFILRIDAIFLQFQLKRASADAQGLGRPGAVAFARVQRLQNHLLFDRLECFTGGQVHRWQRLIPAAKFLEGFGQLSCGHGVAAAEDELKRINDVITAMNL